MAASLAKHLKPLCDKKLPTSDPIIGSSSSRTCDSPSTPEENLPNVSCTSNPALPPHKEENPKNSTHVQVSQQDHDPGNDTCSGDNVLQGHDKIQDKEQEISLQDLDFSDPSTWPFPLQQSVCNAIIAKGPVQKVLGDYPRKDDRSFHNSHFTKITTSKEEQHRDWLLYSEKTDSLFCFACCLFSPRENDSPFANFGPSKIGFCSFGKLSRGVSKHEESHQHFTAVIAWKELVATLRSTSSLSAEATAAYYKEASFWREVLKSLLDAVLFLAKNNLAFRGHNDKIGEKGCGNFLSLIELLSHYHPPLALHIERMKPGKVNYMSPATQNEFICLAGKTVKESILAEIKKRKYFSILFDATPDCSHKEQISQVIRTVNVMESGCQIEENFIDFIHFDKKTGLEISNAILKKLKDDGLDIMYCRGQGYDNGANMAGIYNGVQSHILNVNPSAFFVPCAAHSLNLVGQNAGGKVLAGKLILGQIQNLYTFFSSSTMRWNKLMEHVKVTLKSQSATRWSSKASALQAISSNFGKVIIALEEITKQESFNAQTMADATSQLHQILNFKFIFGMVIWEKILSRINVVNVALQSAEMEIEGATNHLKGLLEWMSEFRQDGFDACLTEAKKIAETVDVSEDSGFSYRSTRGRVPARFRKESEDKMKQPQSNLEKFRDDFFTGLMNSLEGEFSKRFEALQVTSSDFNFLWGQRLESNCLEDQRRAVLDLALKYSEDLDGAAMIKEAEFLKTAITAFLPKGKPVSKTNAMDILNILTANNLTQQFINCHTSLRIFLTLPVTVASNERSFSKLKIIKNQSRSKMGQERLSGLAILSIEYEYAEKLSFNELIEKFILKKCRRVNV